MHKLKPLIPKPKGLRERKEANKRLRDAIEIAESLASIGAAIHNIDRVRADLVLMQTAMASALRAAGVPMNGNVERQLSPDTPDWRKLHPGRR